MSATAVVVQGVVKPDGTLELEGKLLLPAGKVQVTVQPLPDLPADDPFWQRMRAIWDAQNTAGHVPRSAEEIEAQQREMREGWARRQEALEQLQEESRRLRRADQEPPS